MSNIFRILLAAFLVTGCSNYNAVTKAHQSDVAVIKLRPIENVQPASHKTFRIRSVTIDEAALPSGPDFVKTETFILPLGLFNYWKHRTDYVLGKKQFGVSLEDEIREAFQVGLEQHGYRVTSEKPNFDLDIHVRRMTAKSTYEKSGFFYFALVVYGFGSGTSRGPYQSHLEIDVETHEDGRSYTSEVEGEASLPLKLFHDETDAEVDRISRALSLSLNDAIVHYAAVAPK